MRGSFAKEGQLQSRFNVCDDTGEAGAGAVRLAGAQDQRQSCCAQVSRKTITKIRERADEQFDDAGAPTQTGGERRYHGTHDRFTRVVEIRQIAERIDAGTHGCNRALRRQADRAYQAQAAHAQRLAHHSTAARAALSLPRPSSYSAASRQSACVAAAPPGPRAEQ